MKKEEGWGGNGKNQVGMEGGQEGEPEGEQEEDQEEEEEEGEGCASCKGKRQMQSKDFWEVVKTTQI